MRGNKVRQNPPHQYHSSVCYIHVSQNMWNIGISDMKKTGKALNQKIISVTLIFRYSGIWNMEEYPEYLIAPNPAHCDSIRLSILPRQVTVG